MHDRNHLGQAIGVIVPQWQAPAWPGRVTLAGDYCRVVPIDPSQHTEPLFHANALDKEGRMWTYLPYGPFTEVDSFYRYLQSSCLGDDPLVYAIIDKARSQAVGMAAYMRIAPAAGTIEVGGLTYSPLLQRSTAATEAMYLMMRHAFSLGYRRYEWKCNALNAASRAAAQRLGFSYEGVFRQANVIKGRNRDTAWYAVIDQEWPPLERAYRRWLAPENFDAQGRQRVRLSEFTAPLLAARG